MNNGLKVLKWTVACVAFVFVFGYVTMTLWNWLIPPIFNGPAINYWQALGLLLLSKILFGGFGGKHWGDHSSAHWKHRYYEKLKMMTPEDKERFKARLREKWCYRDKNASTEKTDTSVE
jgi:hypothetical protein